MADLTPKECFRRRLRMEETEYVPVFPRDLTLGIDAAGLRFDDFNVFDPKVSARCVLELQKMCGHDVTVGHIQVRELGAFGGKITRSTNGMPQLAVAPFADIERMDEFQPEDGLDNMFWKRKESMEITSKTRPDLGLVFNTGAPFGTSMGLRGIEQFLMDSMLNPEIVDRLFVFGSRLANLYVEEGVTEDTDAVFLAAAYDNPDIVGDEIFSKYSVPGVKGIVKTSHDLGYPIIFHPHGVFSTDDRHGLLAQCVDTGVDGMQFAESNEPEGFLYPEVDGKCAVLGGLDAYTSLLLGNPKRIFRDCDRNMDVLEGHAYIPMCSCSLHVGMPIESLRLMVEAYHTYRERNPA